MIVKRPKKGPVIGGTIVRRSETVGERSARAGHARGGGVHEPAPREEPAPYLGGLSGKWIALCAALLVVCALAGGGAWAWQSPYFKIDTIEIQGNSSVEQSTLAERSGLLGKSMFSADLAHAQQALFGIALVKNVHIERSWPHTIKISIEERQPWGTWEQAGVGYTIDRDGIVLGTVRPPDGSPVIRSSALTTERPGEHVDYQAVDAAAQIFERLPRTLGTQVTEVAFLGGKGVQVTTADGQTALFGDSSGITYKLAVWAAMAAEARAQHINYNTVDLRFGNRPVLQ